MKKFLRIIIALVLAFIILIIATYITIYFKGTITANDSVIMVIMKKALAYFFAIWLIKLSWKRIVISDEK